MKFQHQNNEVLLNKQCYAADKCASEKFGIPTLKLMENAGQACARAICEKFSQTPTLVICGPGNNGGDGFVIARALKQAGWQVVVALHGDKSKLTGDAADMAKKWRAKPRTIESVLADDKFSYGLVVDALFGAGLRLPIRGKLATLIYKITQRKIPVMSVDLPSGILGDSGLVSGGEKGACFKASLTVSFFRAKPAHLLYPGRKYCGDIQIVDIGIPDQALADVKPSIFENEPSLWRRASPTLLEDAHKYQKGSAIIISGGFGRSGAARLAARAALRIGAGLVTITSPKDAMAENAAQLTSIMLRDINGARALAGLLEDKRHTSICLGPGMGLGRETREMVLSALESGQAVVLDADALTSFEAEPDILFEHILKNPSRPVVLTPHKGEFDRLFAETISASSSRSKLVLSTMAAKTSGAIIIHKGPDTVIAHPDGRAVINTNAPVHLATAGSGDVLAGIITGLLAQNMPVYEAACAATWLHGAAANSYGRGLIAEDLADTLPQVMWAL